MDTARLHPADLNEEALQILQEAEASINRCNEMQDDPVILIALNDTK